MKNVFLLYVYIRNEKRIIIQTVNERIIVRLKSEQIYKKNYV